MVEVLGKTQTQPLRSSRRQAGLPPEFRLLDDVRLKLKNIMADDPPVIQPAAVVANDAALNGQRRRGLAHVEMYTFRGLKGEDAKSWLKDYKRFASCHAFTDPERLENVSFFLRESAKTWFENREEIINGWNQFCEMFINDFADEHKIKQAAKDELRSRVQRKGETCQAYVEAVVKLCRQIDPAMSEEKKVRHIIKGIAQAIYTFLVLQKVKTVAAISTSCQELDVLWAERLASSGSEDGHRLSHAPLFPDFSIGETESSPPEREWVRAGKLKTQDNQANDISKLTLVLNTVVTRLDSIEKQIQTTRQVAAVSTQEFDNSSVSFNNQRRYRPPPRCHYCGIAGHMQRECRRRSADFRNQNQRGPPNYWSPPTPSYGPPVYQSSPPNYFYYHPPYDATPGSRHYDQQYPYHPGNTPRPRGRYNERTSVYTGASPDQSSTPETNRSRNRSPSPGGRRSENM